MSAFEKILNGISQTIKMQAHIESLSDKLDAVLDRVKENERDIRDLEKRLIRIETYKEIAEKVKKLT